eukprot:4900274-Karenia_brevis.AAC.1
MADALAKQAAETVRHPPSVRRRLKEEFQQAKELAMFVGRLTLEATAHKETNGHVARDSSAANAQQLR